MDKRVNVNAYMPCPKVGRVHHHSTAELLQHRLWEDSTTISHKEALTLHLPQ